MMESGLLPGQSTLWRRRVNRRTSPWSTSNTSKIEKRIKSVTDTTQNVKIQAESSLTCPFLHKSKLDRCPFLDNTVTGLCLDLDMSNFIKLLKLFHQEVKHYYQKSKQWSIHYYQKSTQWSICNVQGKVVKWLPGNIVSGEDWWPGSRQWIGHTGTKLISI